MTPGKLPGMASTQTYSSLELIFSVGWASSGIWKATGIVAPIGPAHNCLGPRSASSRQRMCSLVLRVFPEPVVIL